MIEPPAILRLFPVPSHDGPNYASGTLPTSSSPPDPNIGERTVFDPFAGSGSVLTEAMFRGLGFLGMDVNPLAVLLCKVRLGPFRGRTAGPKIRLLTRRHQKRTRHLICDRSELPQTSTSGLAAKQFLRIVSHQARHSFLGIEPLVQKILLGLPCRDACDFAATHEHPPLSSMCATVGTYAKRRSLSPASIFEQAIY